MLGEASVALDAGELSRRVGIHQNTARWHLQILEEAGLVRSDTARRAGPGRPRRVYRTTTTGAARPDEHEALAAALVDTVAGQAGGAGEAQRSGRRLGLAEARRADAETADAVAGLVEVLDRHGFAPTREGDEVTMHRCPFPGLARTSPAVVCGVHRGLIEGVLEGLGGDVVLDELDVLPRPGACVAQLGRPAPEPT